MKNAHRVRSGVLAFAGLLMVAMIGCGGSQKQQMEQTSVNAELDLPAVIDKLVIEPGTFGGENEAASGHLRAQFPENFIAKGFLRNAHTAADAKVGECILQFEVLSFRFIGVPFSAISKYDVMVRVATLSEGAVTEGTERFGATSIDPSKVTLIGSHTETVTVGGVIRGNYQRKFLNALWDSFESVIAPYQQQCSTPVVAAPATVE